MTDELIERFYGAFARRDGSTMAACYAPDARFSDPVFADLRREQPGAMWRMLTGRAQDLEVRLAKHRDSFSFYAWARQALGPAGLALGWTSLLRRRVQREARAGLDEFMGRPSAGPLSLLGGSKVPAAWGWVGRLALENR